MRIALIDEQPLVREGLASVLRDHAGMVFCGAASNAREGFRLLEEQQPDVVVLDVHLPGLSGIAAVREIIRRWPRMRPVVLSGSCCERDVLNALAAGAVGYVAKRDPVDALVTALRQAERGHTFLGPSVRLLSLPDCVPDERTALLREPDVLEALSHRERQVFDLAIRGFRNREIGQELCIAVKTVGSHRLQINRKLGCSSPTELVYFAATNGMLPGPIADRSAA